MQKITCCCIFLIFRSVGHLVCPVLEGKAVCKLFFLNLQQKQIFNIMMSAYYCGYILIADVSICLFTCEIG